MSGQDSAPTWSPPRRYECFAAEVAAGTSTTHHNHPDEEMVYVVEGRIRVFSGGNEVELGAGELAVFPAYVDHHYEAIEDSMTIEVFGPGRTFGAPAGMGG